MVNVELGMSLRVNKHHVSAWRDVFITDMKHRSSRRYVVRRGATNKRKRGISVVMMLRDGANVGVVMMTVAW